ncbi:hypothetical protein GTY23_42640 [Streptomyces sp. SID5998]|nr:hypothetical protein [Streptomyces sp. SID5998]
MVLLVLVGVVWTGWRCRMFPGGWHFAFTSAYADDRNDLAQARRRAREAEREGRQRVSRAQSVVNDARARKRERVRTLERRIAGLREPGPGPLKKTLGDLALHHHVLRIKERSVPLAGLQARFEGSADHHYAYVTPADGHETMHDYPHALYKEREVRGFVLHVTNGARREAKFIDGRDAEIRKLEEELQQVTDDDTEEEAARQRLAEVTQEHERDERIKQLRLELEQARDRWKALTGHRPPR